MSHELIGRVPGTPKGKDEIILCINGFERRKTSIYTALKAEHFNKLDSGSGDTKHYSRADLLAVTNNKEVWDKLRQFERAFILMLLEHCFAKGIEITFA